MLVKIDTIWVNPEHVVLVYPSHSQPGSTEVRMSPEESAIEVPLPLDEVAEKLIAGDINVILATARDALESILEEVTLEGSKEPVDLDFLRAMALRGLGRAEP